MIELAGVHKSFGSVEVLHGISAHIGRGEVVCIVGPSGSGKSTILRCINGLEAYDANFWKRLEEARTLPVGQCGLDRI